MSAWLRMAQSGPKWTHLDSLAATGAQMARILLIVSRLVALGKGRRCVIVLDVVLTPARGRAGLGGLAGAPPVAEELPGA